MDVDVMVWNMFQNLPLTQIKEKEREERDYVHWKDIGINIWTLILSDFSFFTPQNFSLLMWKFLSVSVFQRQQEVKKYERHVEGGHLGKKKKKKANLSIEHPSESKENNRV